MSDPLFSTEDLAGYLGIPIATVYAMNHKGTAPRRIKVGKHVRYRKSDVDSWLDEHSIGPEPAA